MNEVTMLIVGACAFVLLWGLVGLCVGRWRGHGFAGFLWGVVLGPLGCLIACHFPERRGGDAAEKLLASLLEEVKACGLRLDALEAKNHSEEAVEQLREQNTRYIKTMQYVCDRLADMCDHLGVKETNAGAAEAAQTAEGVSAEASAEELQSVAVKPIALKPAVEKELVTAPPEAESAEGTSAGEPA